MDNTDDRTQDQSRVASPLRWLETLFITGFCFALGAWNRPDDPFYLAGNFPWPIIAPLLVGLRYGFFMALVSALLIIAALGGYQRLQPSYIASFPFVWSLGILAVSLLAGEFRDYWERQRQQLQASNLYRQSRLEEFTRNYYLLKVSHDRLEQQLAGSSSSLREALRRLYADIGKPAQPGLTRHAANTMLQLLVRYGQLQIAAIYSVNDGQLGTEPLATTGRFKAVSAADPLLHHGLTERTLVSIQTEYRQRRKKMNTELLAVIPLIDSDDRYVGICAIEAMPFFNFEPKTLRFLAILAGHMADMIYEQAVVSPMDNQDLRTLWRHLARVGRDADQFKLPAALVGLTLPDSPNSWQVAEHVRRIRRGLDVIAEDRSGGQHRVLILMPLTDELGLAGYMQRLDDELREHQGTPLSEWEVRPQTLQITSRMDTERWLEHFLQSDVALSE